MNEFIEKNRRLLKFYSVAAQSIAVVLLISAPIFIITTMFSEGSFSGMRGRYDLIHLLLHLFLDYMIPCFLALLVAQFIKHLTEMDGKTGWILRHGAIILYICATLVVVNDIWQWVFYAVVIKHSALDALSTIPPKILCVFVSLLLTATKVLVMVGLGQALRRILPVIEESKSLV